MSTSGRQWAIEYAPGKGAAFPVSTVIGSPVLGNAFGAPPWQTAAVVTSTQSVKIPGRPAGQAVQEQMNIQLTTFPNPLTLAPSAQGIVTTSVSLAANQLDILVGMPYVCLTFGTGSILAAPGVGTTTFTLQPGASYANPVLSVTITAYFLTTVIQPFYVPFTVQATLYGFSSS